jgi:hypothetical protein
LISTFPYYYKFDFWIPFINTLSTGYFFKPILQINSKPKKLAKKKPQSNTDWGFLFFSTPLSPLILTHRASPPTRVVHSVNRVEAVLAEPVGAYAGGGII